MVVAAAAHESPVGQKSGRKALQAKNNNSQITPQHPNPTTTKMNTCTPPPQPKAKPDQPLLDLDNKENIPPPPPPLVANYIYSSSSSSSSSTPVIVKNKNKEAASSCFGAIESLDASLAEELSAIREKLERLRVDREKTEKMLGERGLMLDLRIKELIHRGDTSQKQLEIEVDRLYRLKEIKFACCLRRSPVRTLREKEHEKKIKQDQLKANIRGGGGGVKDEDEEHREERRAPEAESSTSSTRESKQSSLPQRD